MVIAMLWILQSSILNEANFANQLSSERFVNTQTALNETTICSQDW